MILPTRLKVLQNASQVPGDITMEEPVTYEPLKRFYLSLAAYILLIQVIGLGIAFWYDFSMFNLLGLLGVSVGIPLLLSFIGFYTSWTLKKWNVSYKPVEWDFQPIQLKIQEAGTLISRYRKKYSRLVAASYVWYYYLPILFIIMIFTFPIYTVFLLPSLTSWNAFVYVLLLNAVSAISFWGGWRSTSTAASRDFTLPLIREALKLAKTQSNIKGISHVRIVLDRAVHDKYEVYRNPRVVTRVGAIQDQSYIESWSEELGSIDRVMIRILEEERRPEVVWWWQNRDRWFRKYIGDSEESYYVRNPVPSRIKELGVKDVQLVTENAVAILLLEWMKVRDTRSGLAEILEALEVGE